MKSQAGNDLDIILDNSSEDIGNRSNDYVHRDPCRHESSLQKIFFSNQEEFLAFRVYPAHHLVNILRNMLLLLCESIMLISKCHS